MALRLLTGLSWKALALVAAFCALQALEWVLSPKSGVMGGDAGDLALGFLSRLTVFLITGADHAGGRHRRAERLRPRRAARAFPSPHRGRGERGRVALVRYAIGATPVDEGPGASCCSCSARGSARAPFSSPATSTTCALRPRRRKRAAPSCARARSRRSSSPRACALLQAQVEPHFLFNTLSNARRLSQSDARGADASC